MVKCTPLVGTGGCARGGGVYPLVAAAREKPIPAGAVCPMHGKGLVDARHFPVIHEGIPYRPLKGDRPLSLLCMRPHRVTDGTRIVADGLVRGNHPRPFTMTQ